MSLNNGSTRVFIRGATCSRLQPRAEQAHPAVDVVAHAAGGDDALFQVEGRHAADGEAVAPVDVGHGQGGAHDPRQGCDVGHLLQALVGRRLGSISLEQKISPRVRILPSRGISQRYASICRSLIIESCSGQLAVGGWQSASHAAEDCRTVIHEALAHSQGRRAAVPPAGGARCAPCITELFNVELTNPALPWPPTHL